MVGQRTSAQSASATSGTSCPDGLAWAQDQVRGLLAEQHSKAAVEAAKELHKRYQSPTSESLLIEAYAARIRDLLKHGMSTEANSLLSLVIERFPSSIQQLEDVLLEVRMNEGNLDEFVARLEDPNLAPSVREKLETWIRRRIVDLTALSRAASLAPTHSLREAAAALIVALEAVTRQPVEEADLLLPQVSHRSPLASWKALVKAIATFHRRDDETCRRWLRAIAPDSVPARLVPAIQAMLGSGISAALSSAAQELVAAIGAGEEALRLALASLESALAAKKSRPILEKARAAVSACDRFRPDLREKLRQSISIRCMLLGLGPDQVRDAIGGPTRKDARWHHMMARALESNAPGFDGLARAILAWETFRALALEEKWFAANSVEDGVLSLHMADLAARIPADVANDIVELADGQHLPLKGALRPQQLFSADALYQRACDADPHLEAFQSWLVWAKKQRDWRVADRVAESWRQARPQDVAPLLWLMESSEQRSAYQKALKYLEHAEQLDRLNPEVGKAKLRLLLAGVLRHFRQRKPHLASQGIERIEAVPALDGGWAPLVSALRRVCAALDHDPAAVDRHTVNLEARMGNPVASYLLHQGIVDASVLALGEAPLAPLDLNSYDDVALLKGVAKACALGDSVGIPLAIPENWEERLSASLMHFDLALDTAEMLVVGEAAVRSQMSRLPFVVSVAGLARGGADARFLFLRARALPPWTSERRYDCLSAALALARRERNPELAGKLLDELRGRTRNMFGPDDFVDDREGYSIEPGFVNEVLADERAAKQFPLPARDGLASADTSWIPSKYRLGGDEFAEEEQLLDEEDLTDLEELLANMPPGLARELTLAIARGGSPEEILKGILLGRTETRRLEELFEILPPEVSREIDKAMARGATPRDILEAIEEVISGGDPPKAEFQRGVPKKGKRRAMPPQQESLF